MKKDLFDLTGKKILVAGGAGYLGSNAIIPGLVKCGAQVILGDINIHRGKKIAKQLNKKYTVQRVISVYLDVTSKTSIKKVIMENKDINCLINAACNNPKQSKNTKSITEKSRFENFSFKKWQEDMNVGLTGAFLLSQEVGNLFIKNNGGKIINIASDLALMQQDQSLYRKNGLPEQKQPVKPVSYSVLKSGLVALTKYMASYPMFNNYNVRINCICPGPFFNPDMSDEFVEKLSRTIPIGRVGKLEELEGIIVYLCSDSSDYIQGTIISIDGGRTLL